MAAPPRQFRQRCGCANLAHAPRDGAAGTGRPGCRPQLDRRPASGRCGALRSTGTRRNERLPQQPVVRRGGVSHGVVTDAGHGKGHVVVFRRPSLGLAMPQVWWCRGTESNCRHQVFQTCALPTELPRRSATQCTGRSRPSYGAFGPSKRPYNQKHGPGHPRSRARGRRSRPGSITRAVHRAHQQPGMARPAPVARRCRLDRPLRPALLRSGAGGRSQR